MKSFREICKEAIDIIGEQRQVLDPEFVHRALHPEELPAMLREQAD